MKKKLLVKLPFINLISILVLFGLLSVVISKQSQQLKLHAQDCTNCGIVVPQTSPIPTAALSSWWVRDMGMTAVTHDTVCNQTSQINMTRLVSYIAQFHANFASDDAPLDSASTYNCTFGVGNAHIQPYQYMLNWANTMHAAGLHVIYRGNWNNFAGDYGQPKLSYSTNPAIPYESAGGLAAVLNGTDQTSYIGMTYQWILAHPGIFQDGDIWEPFGEPQNNGITNGPPGTSAANCPQSICQFPSTAAFNQWLSDFSQADQAAFAAIGKNVTSGWFGLAGDSYTYVTQAAMANSSAYNMDHFAQSYSSFTDHIVSSHSAFPSMPITLEWGDVNNADNTDQLVANTTDQYLGWLVQQPYVSGFEYWYESGQGPGAESAAVDFNTGQMTLAGQIVEKYFAMEQTASLIPSPDSQPAASYASSITLSGTKDSSITNVIVDDSSAGITYPDSTHWQLNNFPLSLGSNSISIYGEDASNNTTMPATQTINRHKIGDINGDSNINLTDFSIFANDWLHSGNAIVNSLSDINGNGIVDLTDFSIFASMYGN